MSYSFLDSARRQYLLSDKEVDAFYSYDTKCATINWNEKSIKLFPDWDYSTTTGKYRNEFFNYIGFKELSTVAGVRKALKAGSINGYSISLA